MDIFQKLTIVTCVTSSITLMIVGTALLPHLKSGMVVIRDACLWAAFVLMLFLVTWYGWNRRTWDGIGRPSEASPSRASLIDVSVEDRYYRGQ